LTNKPDRESRRSQSDEYDLENAIIS